MGVVFLVTEPYVSRLHYPWTTFRWRMSTPPVPALMGFPTTMRLEALLSGSFSAWRVALMRKLAVVSKLILRRGLVLVSMPRRLQAR